MSIDFKSAFPQETIQVRAGPGGEPQDSVGWLEVASV